MNVNRKVRNFEILAVILDVGVIVLQRDICVQKVVKFNLFK